MKVLNISYWLDIINFALVILIWLVQLIIYPSFAHIVEDEFISWHRKYVRTISTIVTPLMAAQMVLIIVLLNYRLTWAHICMLLSVLVIWVSSFSLSVPCHKKLSINGKDQTVIGRLVGTNWIRTLLWSAVFLLGILF